MTAQPRRFRVERAGTSTTSYGPGWFTHDAVHGTAAWFPTWDQAYAFARRGADRETKRIIRALDRDTLADRLARLHRKISA